MNVLIRLERESRLGIMGTASQFLASLPETRLCITPTIAGEFGCGVLMADRPVWDEAILPYELLSIDVESAWHFGEIYRHLSSQGNLIGTNDLWIAATAQSHDLPIATGNVDEFRRVPKLQVLDV
jgi:predicted nucleic acid-binding protein